MPSKKSSSAEVGAAHLALTESQRRIISTSLRYAEELVFASRRLVRERDDEGPRRKLLTMHGEFPPARARELSDLLDTLLDTLYLMSDRAGVVPERRSIRRSLSAQLSSAWETLEDLRPRRLKAYGAVNPTTAQELEPLIETATGCIQRILDVSRATDLTPGR